MISSACSSRLLLPLGLCFLLLFHGSLADQASCPRHQSSRLSGRSNCRFEKITARLPNRWQDSEAGYTEFWDSGSQDELECAGVEVVRHTIYSKGLVLPYYPSTPELVYVVQGRGLQGTVLPECDETYETWFWEGFSDEHQKVYRYKQGDVLALPAGALHWTYNDGDRPIVLVVLRDTSNVANQLDRNFRKFFLAGNPQTQLKQEQQWGKQAGAPGMPGTWQPGAGGQGSWQPAPGGHGSQQATGGRGPWQSSPRGQGPWQPSPGGQGQWQPSPGGQGPWQPTPGGQGQWQQEQEGYFSYPYGQRQQQTQERFNMFTGFDDNILQETFNIEYEIMRQLKGLYDDRGVIVLAKNFKVSIPEEQDQYFSPRGNGLEQTKCSTQLRANIANPVFVDVYNPRGGQISSLNNQKLQVLDNLQLSAERGVLFKNALLAPHYNLNAHSIIYITNGSSRLQIVRNDGSRVFDDWVEAGQLIVVPQDFAVIKKAGEQGCEWVAFKTNENAMTAQLAGRFSYIRALPENVIVNSYNISLEEAKSLKYNRKEGVVLSPASGFESWSGSPMKKVKNVVLNAVFG